MGYATGALNRVVQALRPHMRPAFIIVGAQKAGTSALFRMLAAHPQVKAPQVKELHFFDNDATYAKGIRYYRSQFPKAPATAGVITFEATPSYLFIERSAARIKEHLPQVRIIVVLRDPVKRAYSAWNMFRDFKTDPVHGHLYDARPFVQAVQDELDGKDVRWENRYLARGYYAPQVKRYFDLFGRDQVMVIDYGELKTAPLTVVNRIAAWMDLAPFTGSEPELSNRSNERPYPERMDPVLADRLYAHFAPHTQELQQLLGPQWVLDERRP